MSASGFDWIDIAEAFASADAETRDKVRRLVRPGGRKVQWSDMTKAQQLEIAEALGLAG